MYLYSCIMECSRTILPDSRLTEVVAVSSVEGRRCSCCGHDSRKQVLQLEGKVKRLEEALEDNGALIASLRAKNRETTAQLVELQLQKVRAEDVAGFKTEYHCPPSHGLMES
jgi:hypothetical protein